MCVKICSMKLKLKKYNLNMNVSLLFTLVFCSA